jgi:hypothetical protein
MSPVLFSAAQGSRHDKACKKQVAMIAQKVMDANQTQHERSPFVASSIRELPHFGHLGSIINRCLDQSLSGARR